MKKVAIASLLALATAIPYAAPMMFAQNQDSQSAPITIKDPAEYAAYNNAIGQSNPQAKAQAMESFLQMYPSSVVKVQVLEQLMVTYQQEGDLDNTLKTAQRLLQIEPDNLRALAISVYILKSRGATAMQTSPQAAQAPLDQAAELAQKGLAAPKPSSLSDADYQRLKGATAPIFDSAIALDDENKKDLAGAIQYFTNELKAYPDPAATQSGPGLNDTYLLGQAYAQQYLADQQQKTPPAGAPNTAVPNTAAGAPSPSTEAQQKAAADLKNAAWFLTRAAQFAPAQAKPQIEKAAEYFYNKYHGSMDGYPQVQALAQANLFPPADYNPTPAPPPPSPADLAAQTVSSTPDLKSLSLSDKEFILFNGKPDDAQKVWDVMKGQRVEVPGQVIAATASSVQLAVTEDNKNSRKADFTINMKTPLRTIPQVGSDVTYDATFDSYTGNPPMITLTDGALPARATKPSPTRRRR